MDAVKAPGAIQSSYLSRHEKIQFTSSLLVIASDAVIGRAGLAGLGISYSHFQWRHHRLDEMELADGTDVLAEGGAAEEAVDRHGKCEIRQDDPGGPPGGIPQTECFVGPEENDEEHNSQPLASQETRPSQSAPPEFLGQFSWEHEWASKAEEIACDEQGKHDQSSPMNPREYACQIHRADLGSKQTVKNDGDRQKQHQRLHASTKQWMPNGPAEPTCSEQVE